MKEKTGLDLDAFLALCEDCVRDTKGYLHGKISKAQDDCWASLVNSSMPRLKRFLNGLVRPN